METTNATIERIVNHGSIIETLARTEDGRLVRTHWDQRMFAHAWEGGLRPGSEVLLHETDDGTSVELL